MNTPHLKPMDPMGASFANARASVVNRTHRIIRAEALTMREQKQKKRSLWVPLGIFSMLMLGICYAVWGLLDNYDATPNGIPDASDQMMLLLLWSVPVTAVLVGTIWLTRSRTSANSEVR